MSEYDPIAEAEAVLAKAGDNRYAVDISQEFFAAMFQIYTYTQEPLTTEEVESLYDQMLDLILSAVLWEGWQKGSIKMNGFSDDGEITWYVP